MSTVTTDPASTDTEQPNDDPAGLRKQLKERGERLSALEAENATLKRNAAFSEAGIPADGAAKWFRQGYDGELTAEAIKAAAEADGIITPPPPPDPDTPLAEQQAHAEADAATATPPPAPKEFEAQMAEAASKGPAALNAFMEKAGLTDPQ